MAIHLYTLRSHRKTKSCNKYFFFVLHSLRTEQKDHLISFGFARDREEERVCVCVCVYLPVSCNLFAFYMGSTKQSLIYFFFAAVVHHFCVFFRSVSNTTQHFAANCWCCVFVCVTYGKTTPSSVARDREKKYV